MIGARDLDIVWVPRGQFKRKPNKESTVTYTGSGKLTFAGPIADVITSLRVKFGFLDNLLVVRIVTDPNERAYQVSKRNQVSDRGLAKYLDEGTVIKLDFDDDIVAFIETERVQLTTSQRRY